MSRLWEPLAWGGNLWLLLVGWPLLAEAAGGLGIALSALAPLIAGATLAATGLAGLASGCLLVAFPIGVAGAFAVASGGVEPSPIALAIDACSLWVYGAAVSRALRPPQTESGAVRIEALPVRAHSPRHRALRVRAGRVRAAAIGLIALGAAAIAIVAPYAGDAGELHRAFGRDPRHAAVLVAMVAAAVAVGVAGAFMTALVRPPTADDRRPGSPVRAALAAAIALAGLATYLALRS